MRTAGKNLTTTENKQVERLIFKPGKTKTERKYYTTTKYINRITKY